MERTVWITEVLQQGWSYRLGTGRAAHYENLKPHVPSPEDWLVAQNMKGLEYLLVEPACEVNEKGTREKNDGNEDVIMNDNEKIEVDSDEGSFAEEDWNDPEQNELAKWTESEQPMTTETRKGDHKRTGMRYNRYDDDFLIDNIQTAEIGEELVNVGDLVADEEWQIVHDSEHSLQEDNPDNSVPERERDLEQSEIERRENTKLRCWIGCKILGLKKRKGKTPNKKTYQQ